MGGRGEGELPMATRNAVQLKQRLGHKYQDAEQTIPYPKQSFCVKVVCRVPALQVVARTSGVLVGLGEHGSLPGDLSTCRDAENTPKGTSVRVKRVSSITSLVILHELWRSEKQ